MQKILPVISVLLTFLSCVQKQKEKDLAKENLFFQALISPAFEEHAEVTILKTDSIQKIDFLLRDAEGNDKPSDTFYFKTLTLSESQFHKIDSELIQKAIKAQSIQKHGMRDGIWVGFTVIQNSDTTIISLDNPQKEIDSAAFEIIKNGFVNFQSIFNDTIINEYLDEVETYIDHSKDNQSPMICLN